MKDFVENIENEIPGLNSYLWAMINFNFMVLTPSKSFLIFSPIYDWLQVVLLNLWNKDENKIQIRELLHELEEMTCELEQIQMKDLVDILRSDMDSLVERLSTSVGFSFWFFLIGWRKSNFDWLRQIRKPKSEIVEVELEKGKTIHRKRSVKFELK